MDGLAVATAVIQFLEFSGSLIAKGIAIHSSLTGLTVDHTELQNITESLLQTSDEIQQSLKSHHGRHRLTGNEKDLEKIAGGCQGVANELLEVLTSLTAKGPKTRWRSFRHALRATWSEGKVKSLEDRLDRFRQQMMSNVLVSLRQEADRSIREQSSIKESVERIEQRQQNNILVGDRFVRQVMDGEQWRRDLIEMIHEQGQGGLQRMANITQLKDDRGSTPNAVVVQEKRIRERILHKLAFRNMTDRERRVSKAHRQTFQWIFCDPKSDSRPWSNFKDFLERPNNKKIYWITGKPGSGKSTLMKFIRHHPETANLLRTWSGNGEVIQAAFYFWNSGSRMQMSVGGLLQTVLYECLRGLPKVIQKVLPERWEVATLFDVDDFPWSWEELAQALRRLIIEVCPEKKFFVMIDGLDECSGDQVQLVELITELAEDTENLKLCVASRPWNNFEDAFRDRPSLMLQDLSATDIELYIRSRFNANEGFAEFQLRDPSSAKELLETISKKAEGVFLWVHLVVQSLLEGLTNGDGLRYLRSRLEKLPPNLEDLYANILEHLDDNYLDHASRLFQLVRACDDSPTLLRIALADLEDSEWAMQAPVKPMSYKEESVLCKNMKRKLSSRCRGLLDISSPVIQRPNNSHPELEVAVDEGLHGFRIGEAGGEECDTSIADLEVQYLHRSVRDYIQSPEIWSWLISANEEPFDPHFYLLKSYLLQLKRLPAVSLSAREMGFHIWMAIKYAKRSLNIFTKKKKGQVKEVVLLLDEMDKAATILTSSPARHNSTFVDRGGIVGSDHWSSFFLIRVSDSSFPHMMAVCGIHQYLEMRLRSSDPSQGEGDYDDDTRGGDKTALMIAALEGAPVIPEMEGHHDLFGCRIKVLKTLLRKGGDCHKLHQGRSAWDLASNAGSAEILELFEEYRGKPPPRSSLNGRRSPTTHRGLYDGHQSDNESNASTEAVSGMEPHSTNTARKPNSSHERISPTRPWRNPDMRSGEEQWPNGRIHRPSPHPTRPDYLQYTDNPRLPRRNPPLQPRTPPALYYSSPSQPLYDARWAYDENGDEEDNYHYRAFPRDYTTRDPPSYRHASSSRRGPLSMPRHVMPNQPLYGSITYSMPPWYWTGQRSHPLTATPLSSIPRFPHRSTEQQPYASHRSGWLGGPPPTTRSGYGGTHEYW